MAAVVGGVCLWPQLSALWAPAAVAVISADALTSEEARAEAEATAAVLAVDAPAEEVQLAAAIAAKSLAAEFTGNGRERMSVMAMNKGTVPLRITVPVGQMFQGGRNKVIVVRPSEVEVAPGKTREFSVQTAAIHSTNTVGSAVYQITDDITPRIELLLTRAQNEPELPVGAIQSAILSLMDNLPLSALAKFKLATGALPSRFNTDDFRTDTFDLIAALTILRETRVPEATLALTIDPQLKIEAMIDPIARPVAMRYYGIAPEREWDFWRNELLQGEPTTRHYALYGIARFYPEVALEMLPRWARETRTNPVYRLAAVQALADTQRPEALAILRDLSRELGGTTELARAASGAADYLDWHLGRIASARGSAVAFRGAVKVVGVQ